MEKDDCMSFPTYTEMGCLQAAMSSLTAATATTGALIQTRAAQLSGDSQAMWSIAMTTPTVNAAMGQRIATESGSGAVRRDTNYPAGYAPAPGGGGGG